MKLVKFGDSAGDIAAIRPPSITMVLYRPGMIILTICGVIINQSLKKNFKTYMCDSEYHNTLDLYIVV